MAADYACAISDFTSRPGSFERRRPSAPSPHLAGLAPKVGHGHHAPRAHHRHHGGDSARIPCAHPLRASSRAPGSVSSEWSPHRRATAQLAAPALGGGESSRSVELLQRTEARPTALPLGSTGLPSDASWRPLRGEWAAPAPYGTRRHLGAPQVPPHQRRLRLRCFGRGSAQRDGVGGSALPADYPNGRTRRLAPRRRSALTRMTRTAAHGGRPTAAIRADADSLERPHTVVAPRRRSALFSIHSNGRTQRLAPPAPIRADTGPLERSCALERGRSVDADLLDGRARRRPHPQLRSTQVV
jgi:hypothetical protein